MIKRNILLLPILLCIVIPVVHAANWQNIETFTGASTQDTDYFTVTATEWRIRWSYTPASGLAGDLAVFGFNLFEKDGQFTKLPLLKTGRNETSGTTYVHEGQKDYYLKISVANLATSGYTIIIEQDTETIPNPASYLTAAVIVLIIVIVVIVLAVLLLKKRRNPKQTQPPPP